MKHANFLSHYSSIATRPTVRGISTARMGVIVLLFIMSALAVVSFARIPGADGANKTSKSEPALRARQTTNLAAKYEQLLGPSVVHPINLPSATTYTVDSLADTGGSSCVSPCTLRQAINAANANSGADTISISVTGTINLTGALPDITEGVTINGPGANLLTVRRDTGGDYRIFNVTAASPNVVTFFGMTITNGFIDAHFSISGGGINNSSTATVYVTNCIVTDNHVPQSYGGGIYNGSGTLNVINTTVSNNSGFYNGGIFNGTGILNVTNSTVSDNFGPSNGGIYNAGTVNITNSTLKNNASGVGGGGGTGGGILNVGIVNVTNSTISGNSSTSSGGGIYNGGTLNVTNSTLSGNSAVSSCGGIGDSGGQHPTITNSTITNNSSLNMGGICGGGTLRNDIIALNISGNGPAYPNLTGFNWHSKGHNIFGPIDPNSPITVDPGATGDQNDVTAVQLRLATLADNGGPTFTHALLYNSPAVDAGDDCVFDNTCSTVLASALTTDQRGLSRQVNGDLIAGAHVDVGAYERQNPETRPVPNGTNTKVDLVDVKLSFPCTPFGNCLVGAPGDNARTMPPVGPRGTPTASITVIDPSTQGTPPLGYSVGNSTSPPLPAFDVSTNVTYDTPVGICFYLPSITDQNFFSGLKILHNEDGALVDRTTGQNFSAKIVCGSVNTLSPFVIAQTVTPTAANGNVSGRIVGSTGNPVAGVAIRIGGTQDRETITDAQGNYGFDNVETNGFYTVTPSRANYTFNPVNRSFSLLGVHTEASFTASANSDHANAIDTAEFFVRQQYLDFLGREPDPPGFNGWVNTLRNCAPNDASCDRVHVSEMFFRSQEFQERGYFVYRFYSSAFGRKPGLAEFMPDLARVSGFLTNDQLEAAKVAFTNDFMTRPGFASQYNGLSNGAYLDALINTAAVNLSNRQTMVDGLNAGTLTRAQVLRQIAESGAVYQRYYNQAFVVMEYFGYLRRDPDALYLNWIQVLDANPADSRHMVNGFVNSAEYRNRFAQ